MGGCSGVAFIGHLGEPWSKMQELVLWSFPPLPSGALRVSV